MKGLCFHKMLSKNLPRIYRVTFYSLFSCMKSNYIPFVLRLRRTEEMEYSNTKGKNICVEIFLFH